MGAIARSAANLITTSGVVLKGAVNNDSFDNVTALPSSFGDGITLISSQTASNSASISFTSGLTSTYKAYKFVFVNIKPIDNNIFFRMNGSTNSGSSYGVTSTTTFFRAYHNEAGTATGLEYFTNADLAQSTSAIPIATETSNTSDNSISGSLLLFNPSSTTYVKHFIVRNNNIYNNEYLMDNLVAGYFNTTSAINAVQFTFATGNISDGKIYLYGIK